MSLPPPDRSLSCDVAVVGAGAAGLLAATLLAESRLRVVLASAGPPATAFATGAIDVLGTDAAREVDLGAFLSSLPLEHPYRQAEEAAPGALVGGIGAFRRLALSAGLPYRGRADRTTLALSRAGIEGTGLLPLPTGLAPLYERKALLGIRGATRDAADTAAGLASAVPEAPPRPLDVEIRADALRQAESPEAVSRALAEDDVFDRLVREVRSGLKGSRAEGLLTPPLFDAEGLPRMKELAEEVRLPVEEVLAPLSAGGPRLLAALALAARRAGVVRLEPARAAEAEVSEGEMRMLRLDASPSPLRLVAAHYVLASGALLVPAGGLPRPPLAGFALAAGEAPRLEAQRLHPLWTGPPAAPLENVWVVGSLLGGLPSRRGTGLGPALASAWAAARAIRRSLAGRAG